ncbi:hypothetical protein CPU12_07355 [Malaciobacter molluscorum LMG 25693]|uniref:Membrane protein n=1 Tax=Malaciobacter molluscorum LMG 25693 TaxID=870501 RepID=A0A2G1DHW9_9BACT|nr:DUF6688 family protein [Malaciobacter molluscorum]AXX93018.1 putative membrane protein [Malaciobacter molluscorum LMG 25693]PHO18075.1 hypothetical protein CPU12_07355 [Malaciobacter molluscorum LMG 25693]
MNKISLILNKKTISIIILITVIILIFILGFKVLFFLIFIVLIFPWFITIVNFLRFIENFFFSNVKTIKWQKRFYKINLITIVLGVLFHIILLSLGTDYNEKIIYYNFQFFDPINFKYSLPIIVFCILGFLSFVILDKKRLKLPPLFFVINLSFLLICNILILVFLFHIFNSAFNINSFSSFIQEKVYLSLFPINFLLISCILIKEVINEYCIDKSKKKIYTNKIFNYLNSVIINSQNWIFLAFIFTIPLLLIILSILVLFGQEPDSIIKAFTQTSNWSLSQKIVPPPRVIINGHYLCTVSLRGHENIVKPKRMGIRGGKKIVVNRQLMIANAFEDVIQEKFPNFHKLIRGIYDKYGFPLSKIITTRLRADIIYILMKPLEYIFLIFLYLVDRNPENRIEVQYLPMKKIFINI